MAHPFQKMFIKALKESDELNNRITEEANKIIKKGYSRHEVYQVLDKLKRSLIEDKEREIIAETIEELDLSDSGQDED